MIAIRLRAAALIAALAALAAPAAPAAADDPFSVQAIPLGGRVVQADLVDLDGDARAELLCIRMEGMPPGEQRTIHVFYQRSDHTFPSEADWSAPLPSGTAAYDLAELDGQPGAELILLRRDRLTLLSFSDRAPAFRDLPVGPEPTIAAVADERGVDRMGLARNGLGGEPRLLVPGFGTTTVLAPSGEILARLDVGARANYFLQRRPGPFVSESEVEIYFDHPRLSVGDVDGDGRGDIVSANRHELRVFAQNAQGGFPANATRRIALGLLSPEDHVRNTGMVRVDAVDLDDDRRVDLLISRAVGSLFSTSTKTTVGVHLNRNGDWNLAKPDQQFHTEGGLTGNVVIDLDGDGRVELIEARIPAGVLEVVEVLVTRAVDAEVSIYRRAEKSPFGAKPWQRWSLDVPFSFKTFRSLGFIPTLEADLNGDGFNDLLASGAGDRLEVRLGRADTGYATVNASQPLDTGGRIRFGDLDGDRLTDFVIYDSRRPGTPVLVGHNRGVLPDTPAALSPR
jgi:VCBS repeat protein